MSHDALIGSGYIFLVGGGFCFYLALIGWVGEGGPRRTVRRIINFAVNCKTKAR